MKPEIQSTKITPPRRTTVDFPSYRYVPGKAPHPFRHPDGHMYHGEPQWPIGETWGTDPQFSYAADLFDHGYYWEAHEQWEACWKRAENEEKKCIQGLIQMSAAILKHNMGHLSARDKLFQAAVQKLSYGRELAWDIGTLEQDTKDFFSGGLIPSLPIKIPIN